MNNLTLRQQKFIRAYVQCGVGAEAARRAGYAPGSADVAAARLLGNVGVQQAVQAVAAAQGDTPDGVLSELRDLGTRAAQAGRYAPTVRAVELRGKALGMWQADSSTGRGKVTIQIFDSSVSFGDSHPGNEGLVIEGESTSTSLSQAGGSTPDDEWE